MCGGRHKQKSTISISDGKQRFLKTREGKRLANLQTAPSSGCFAL